MNPDNDDIVNDISNDKPFNSVSQTNQLLLGKSWLKV